MASVGQIRDALRLGVADEIWDAYAQQLKAQGATLIVDATDERGARRYQVEFGPHNIYRNERGTNGLWQLAS